MGISQFSLKADTLPLGLHKKYLKMFQIRNTTPYKDQDRHSVFNTLGTFKTYQNN